MAKKIRKNIEIQRATRKFTDREEPRKVFWDKYNMMKDNFSNLEDIFVITYYGIGGIGKSALLRKIVQEIKEKAEANKEKPYYLLYDFEVAQDPETVLTFMKNKLENEYNFDFIRFDFARYYYATNMGKDTNKPEIKSIIQKSKFLNMIVKVAGELPTIGDFAKIIKYVDYAISKGIMNKKHKVFLQNLNEESPEQMCKNLPKYFSEDLTDNIEKLNKPFVILLDTYEKMVNEINNVGFTLTKDLWLRGDNGPILNVPGVLWVIAGREKIRWGKNDADWEDSLDQHRLGDLSFNDANDFLQEAGIEEENIRKQIYKITNGTPVYLDLCVSTYEDIINSGEEVSIDNFGDTKEELIERYVRYMDVNTREMVYMLALLGNWDDNTINEVGYKLIPNFSLEQYETMKEMSFVYENDGQFYIHKTVQTILNNICPKMLVKKYDMIMTEFYKNKLLELASMKEAKRDYKCLYKLYDVKTKIMTDTNIDEIANEIYCFEKELDKIDPHFYFFLRYAYSIYSTKRLLCQKKYGHDDERTIRAILEQVKDDKRYNGLEFQESSWAEEAYETAFNKYGAEHDLTIEAELWTLMGYYDMKEKSNFFEYNAEKHEKYIQMCKDVYELCLRKYGEKNRYTIRALYILLLFQRSEAEEDVIVDIIKLCKLCKEEFQVLDKDIIEEELDTQSNYNIDLEQFEPIFENENIYEMHVKQYGEENEKAIEILYKMADSYNQVHFYKKELQICLKIYEICLKIYGEKSKCVLKVLEQIADKYFYIHNDDEAIKYNIKRYEICIKMYGKEDLESLIVLRDIANMYNCMNNHKKALEIHFKRYEIASKKYGEESKEVLNIIYDIEECNYIVKKYKQAIEINLKAYNIVCKLYGQESEELLRVLNNLSKIYLNLNEHEKKTEIDNKAYAICLKIYGEKELCNLVNTYCFEFVKQAYIKQQTEEVLEDLLLIDVIDLVIETGKGTTSFIQRNFKIGYNRALRFMEYMENTGIVSKTEIGKPNKVLISKEEWEKRKSELEASKKENQSSKEKNNEKVRINKKEVYLIDAIDAIIKSDNPSITCIQIEFKIGYNRAEKILKYMENKRIVSLPNCLGKRRVLISEEEWQNMKEAMRL